VIVIPMADTNLDSEDDKVVQCATPVEVKKTNRNSYLTCVKNEDIKTQVIAEGNTNITFMSWMTYFESQDMLHH
jgi:hypothetical protein